MLSRTNHTIDLLILFTPHNIIINITKKHFTTALLNFIRAKIMIVKVLNSGGLDKCNIETTLT